MGCPRSRARSMVDRDVVREPRPPERSGERRPALPEGGGQEGRGRVLGRELPEAVDDADAEAAGEERPVPLAPDAVLGALVMEARDVVSPVVMHGEVAAAGSQHAI